MRCQHQDGDKCAIYPQNSLNNGVGGLEAPLNTYLHIYVRARACIGEPHEYVHVSVISFLLVMNHEPLIFHKQRIKTGSEKGAKPPPGRGSSPPAAAPARRAHGHAAGPWLEARGGQRSHPGMATGCRWHRYNPGTAAKWGYFLPGSNSFGVSYVGGEGGEQRASAFSPWGWLQRCPHVSQRDPPSLQMHGVLYTCFSLGCPQNKAYAKDFY